MISTLKAAPHAPARPAPDRHSRTPEPDVLPFDRRRELRRPTRGWARVQCMEPLRRFLGGTFELRDVSAGGLNLCADHPLREGDAVEVQLAPFRVRGLMGRVVRCEPLIYTDDLGCERRAFSVGIAFPRCGRAA